MWPKPQETADLVTFTGKNLNEKLHFLCSASSSPRNEHFLYIAGWHLQLSFYLGFPLIRLHYDEEVGYGRGKKNSTPP